MPDRPATLRDVAAAARVHPATASRALNPETRILVSEETARRVTDAAAKLGYRPNPVARSLRTRRSHTVGVLIPDLNNPLFPPIVRGLEDKLAEAGYVALIGNTDADANRERTLFEQMRARHVDGFVLATATLHDQLLAEAAAAEVPVVLMNRLAQDYSFPSVSVDNEQGARMVISTRLPESAILVPHAWPVKPPNTCECTTPSRAHASIVTGSSGTIGMCNVTRSPAFKPQKSCSRAANSFTR